MANKHSSFVDKYLSARRDIPEQEILIRVCEKLIRTEYSLATTLVKLPMRNTAITKYPSNKKNNTDKLDRVNKSVVDYKLAIERLNEVKDRLIKTKTAQHAK